MNKQITITLQAKLRGVLFYKLRIKLAGLICKICGFILNCKFETETKVITKKVN